MAGPPHRVVQSPANPQPNARSRLSWTTASSCSPPSTRSRRTSWRARSRSAASSRCGSPSTRTSRRAARAPGRAAPSCRATTGRPTTRSSRSWRRPAATKRLKLGTGICLVIERDPIVTAKEVATLDRLSGGRVLFGIGGGWNAEEMANHGTAWKTALAAAPRAHAGDEGDLDRAGGRVTTASSSTSTRSGPIRKPVQKPHPPIIIGGDGPTTFDRVVEFGDGWMPIMRPHTNPVERIPALHERLKAAGRDPESAPVSIFFAPPKREALDALAAAACHARHLRPAVGAPRRGAAAARRLREGDARRYARRPVRSDQDLAAALAALGVGHRRPDLLDRVDLLDGRGRGARPGPARRARRRSPGSAPSERVASPRPRMKPTSVCPSPTSVPRGITGSSPLIEP